MAMLDPKIVKFESINDIFDYVTRGMVPFKSDFEALIYGIRNPVEISKYTPSELARLAQDRVVIDANIIDPDEREYNINLLRHIYVNRVHNRRVLVGSAAAAAAVTTVICLSHHKDK